MSSNGKLQNSLIVARVKKETASLERGVLVDLFKEDEAETELSQIDQSINRCIIAQRN